MYSIKYLGRNYSPCFDAHIPFELVFKGPYQFIRHPGWLSKILVCVGTILVAGSIWFVPFLFWIIFEMKRTITIEENILARTFPSYQDYRARTYRVIPFLY